MKTLKIFISSILLIALSFSTSLPAFAAQSDSPTVSDVKKHTIDFIVGPGENIGDNNGITPYIWNQNGYFVNNVCYTTNFQIPDRYFAFEVKGFNQFDQPCNVEFNVNLLTESGSPIAGGSLFANGEVVKHDWITVTSQRLYKFQIRNSTSTVLHVIITYYSWA